MFTDIRGNITSQNYPNTYPSNIECEWDIIVPDGYRVFIFADGIFDIESGGAGSNNCYYDYIQFFDVDANGVAVSKCAVFCS